VAKVPEGIERKDLNVVSRRVLLDALAVLEGQSDALTIVGAQAVYLRSPEVRFSAAASYTSDADPLLCSSPRRTRSTSAPGRPANDASRPKTPGMSCAS
jgi:hypothetical protein